MQHPTRNTYFLIFAALLVLLAVTVGVAFLSLGRWAPLVAMMIAVAKAVLIVLYFMHVRYEVPLVRIFAIAGFLWLVLLFTFMMSDYFTRRIVTRAADAQVEAKTWGRHVRSTS